MFWRRKAINPYGLVLSRVTAIQQEINDLQRDTDERAEVIQNNSSSIFDRNTQMDIIRKNVERAAHLAGEMQGLQRSADLFHAALNGS